MTEQNPAIAEDATQDNPVSAPRQADLNWARMQPIQITASQQRKAAPHQVVSIRNTSPDQKHIVIDRHMVGHELEPGQKKDGIEMLVSDIEYFLRQRSSNRLDAFGRFKPIHPIEIIGHKPIDPTIPVSEPPKRKSAAA